MVETAKHNVLTAYSGEDGLDLLRRFPEVDVALVHAAILSNSPNVLSEIKKRVPELPVILACPFGGMTNDDATYIIDSHHPQELLRLLTNVIAPRLRPGEPEEPAS